MRIKIDLYKRLACRCSVSGYFYYSNYCGSAVVIDVFIGIAIKYGRDD